MKNPKWHRDEIILALDLYFSPDRGTVDSRNPKIIALSEILNRLPIYGHRPDAEKFRNPNGVSLKLSNFMAIDPNHSGKGMKGHSKLDEEIFNEYLTKREDLKRNATQILKVVENKVLLSSIEKIEDDETSEKDSVKEGQVLYKLHKYRERNKKIVEAKKKSVFKSKKRLECEVCNFDFSLVYGEVGQGFIECHHIKPLASNDLTSITKLDDLALVCSNCHRMLHRRINEVTIPDLKIIIQKQNK